MLGGRAGRHDVVRLGVSLDLDWRIVRAIIRAVRYGTLLIIDQPLRSQIQNMNLLLRSIRNTRQLVNQS